MFVLFFIKSQRKEVLVMGSQHEFNDFEEFLESCVQLINSSNVEKDMQGVRDKVQHLYDHHLDTKKTTNKLLNGKLPCST